MNLFQLISFIGVGVIAFRLNYLAKSMLSSCRSKISHGFWSVISAVLFILSLPYMLTFYMLEQSEAQDTGGRRYNEGWQDGYNAAKENAKVDRDL